jgi:hypothetical protein
MVSVPQLAAEIENRFWGQRRRKPTDDDVSRIINSGYATEEFFVHLTCFCEAIDGYAGSARALGGVSREKLLKVRESLSRSFFEVYPQHESCRGHIAEASTPFLYERLCNVEDDRRDLQRLVEAVLARP